MREFTPEEEAHWRQAVAEVEAEKPEMIERFRLTEIALTEQTVCGQLRRAIRASKIQYDVLADRSGLTVRDVGEFMCGRAPLDSDAFARLAAVLDVQLVSML